MIAQVIDDKTGCESVFCNGDIVDIKDLTKQSKILTWKHSSILGDFDCDYAWVWSGGKTLEECCPDRLRDRFDYVCGRLKAHMRSLKTAKVCLVTNCFFDLVPQSLMSEYFTIKNEICKEISKKPKPENYSFLKGVHIMLEEISSTEVNIDPSNLNDLRFKSNVRTFLKRLPNYKKFVQLDMFKSKTGRLTSKKGSFPVLNLKKEFRKVLKPNNDLFVELDYNSAEARVFLSFLGHANIEEDIHEWNMKKIGNQDSTRESMKERFFAWLYNPDSRDSEMESLYNRGTLKERFWDGTTVVNPYGRKLKTDERHCINYLIQSTTNDIVLENALKIRRALMDKKSYISFTLHDSIILDFNKDDSGLLGDIVDIFSNTKMGLFKVNVSMGKNFGEMRSINVT